PDDLLAVLELLLVVLVEEDTVRVARAAHVDAHGRVAVPGEVAMHRFIARARQVPLAVRDVLEDRRHRRDLRPGGKPDAGREPAPARRHGVHLERSVLEKGDLDARHAGHPAELVHALAIDPVPYPVASEEHDAVAGATGRLVEAPAPVGIELDDALEPPLAVEIDPLVGEAQVALDDRRVDRLEVHESRVSPEMARQPFAA